MPEFFIFFKRFHDIVENRRWYRSQRSFSLLFFVFFSSMIQSEVFFLVQSHKPLQSSQYDTDAGQISLSCLQLFGTKSSVVLQTLFRPLFSGVGWELHANKSVSISFHGYRVVDNIPMFFITHISRKWTFIPIAVHCKVQIAIEAVY